MPDTAKSTRPAGNRPGGSNARTSASQRAKDRAEARRQELAAQQQREARNRLLLKIVIPVALVAVIVVVFVVVKVTGGSSDNATVATGQASAAVVNDVTTVPAATFNTVGVGTVSSNVPTAANAPALTADGKPRVLYVGAEFCPYCAAERWPVTVALSRFGTWSNLGQATSAGGAEAYPNTATLSFHGASYSSQYLSFTGYETSDREGKALDTLSADDEALVKQYSNGSIPFIDFGGQYLSSGASYNPGVLADQSHDQIAAALKDPGSDVAKGVDGAANVITATLCKLTNGQPGDVCSSSGVTAAAAKLGS